MVCATSGRAGHSSFQTFTPARERPTRTVLAAFGLVKYERGSIKSWADAQRQPASRARWLSPGGEDVAGPATKRVKPQARRPSSL